MARCAILFLCCVALVAPPLAAEDNTICDVPHSIILHRVVDKSQASTYSPRIAEALYQSVREWAIERFQLPLVEIDNRATEQEITDVAARATSATQNAEHSDIPAPLPNSPPPHWLSAQEFRAHHNALIVVPLINQVLIAPPTPPVADASGDQEIEQETERDSAGIRAAPQLTISITIELFETRPPYRRSTVHADPTALQGNNGVAHRSREALNGIPLDTLGAAILYVDRDLVFISSGSAHGVTVGDEFLYPTSQRFASCRGDATTDTALLKVRLTKEDYSVAQLLIGEREFIKEGTVISDRKHISLEPYTNILIPLAFDSVMIATGLRLYPVSGFFLVRPFFGIEVAVQMEPFVPFFPMNFYGGLELDWYFGRVIITPLLGGGISIGVGEHLGQGFFFSHVGAVAGATVSVWFSRNAAFSINAGYSQWLGIYHDLSGGATTTELATLLRTYGGYLAGLGIRIKL